MSDVILGVITGWALTTAGEAGRAWWRARQSKHEQETAVRLAARLILEELLVSERATRGDRDPLKFQFGTERKLPTDVWNQHRETLAVAAAGAADWETIANAYARIDELNWAFQPGRERNLTEQQELLEEIKSLHALITNAATALRRLS